MIQLGDITKINGGEIPCVNVITGGSPCQDLSVAGSQKGLAGERSGLFHEMIRVIREMKKKNEENANANGPVLRWVVWENVPGALSSNNGDDFRTVIQEFCRLREPGIVIPRPPGGKWTAAGAIMADGYSGAWRVNNAFDWGRTIRNGNTGNVRFLGTPQRRKRISFVFDLAGGTAPGLLFERGGLPRNFEQGRQAWEETPSRLGGGAEVCYCVQGGIVTRGENARVRGAGYNEDMSYTLDTVDHHAVVYESHGKDGRYNPLGEVCQTLTASYGTGGNNKPIVTIPLNTGVVTRQGEERRTMLGIGSDGEPQYTLTAQHHHALCIGNGQANQSVGEIAGALNAMHTQQAVVYSENAFGKYSRADSAAPLRASGGSNGGGSESLVVDTKEWIVRSMTPMECERLQGFPDEWTNIGDWIDTRGRKRHTSNAARYRALGNSIALPFWQVLACRMRQCLGDNPTMGSLFDGIGGFPLAYSRAGFTPVWASEIDEFCRAVTERRFNG